MRYAITILLMTSALLWSSCRQTPVVDIDNTSGQRIKESMINANKVVNHSEETMIDGYVQRRGWDMQRLKCGARMWICHSGNGQPIRNDDTVAVNYKLETLDGTVIYSNQTDTLVVGRRDATAALNEALLQMNQGSQAWLIAPSESAYGVAGDGDRVGSRTVVVYYINMETILNSKK